jgi:four helix bundle protein
MTPDELSERLLNFAARAGKLIDALPDTRLARHIAGQLVRCATSPAPNYAEACAAESRGDFIHKTSICPKELRETRVWLQLIQKAELLPEPQVRPVLNECTELCNILGQTVVTAKRNAQKGPAFR